METTPYKIGWKRIAGYLVIGIYFGTVLVKSEAVSWFRIQEMFRFDSFHMYGILMSAVVVAAISMYILRVSKARTSDGSPITIVKREWEKNGTRYWLGGTIFGLGWALLGACPGPIYTLIGAGVTVVAVSLVAAVGGAWSYGLLRDRLPH